jgi:hypothetical protein
LALLLFFDTSSRRADEEGVFLSQAALDKIEQEKAASRRPLSIGDDDYDAEEGDAEQVLDDHQIVYERDVKQRGAKRRVFDPASVSTGASQRKLLAVGANVDPLTMLLRPLQMKSLLLLLEKKGAKVQLHSTLSVRVCVCALHSIYFPPYRLSRPPTHPKSTRGQGKKKKKRIRRRKPRSSRNRPKLRRKGGSYRKRKRRERRKRKRGRKNKPS